MQNSGLGVSTNAIVSLHQIYDIPALLVVSWRGQGGAAGHDAPEHLIMGDVMEPFLDAPATCRSPSAIRRRSTRDVAESDRDACRETKNGRSPLVVGRKGITADDARRARVRARCRPDPSSGALPSCATA